MFGNEDFEYKFPKSPDNHNPFSLSLYCLKNVSNLFCKKNVEIYILDKLKIPTDLFYAFFPEDVPYNVSPLHTHIQINYAVIFLKTLLKGEISSIVLDLKQFLLYI
jgi:hypothetical protein